MSSGVLVEFGYHGSILTDINRPDPLDRRLPQVGRVRREGGIYYLIIIIFVMGRGSRGPRMVGHIGQGCFLSHFHLALPPNSSCQSRQSRPQGNGTTSQMTSATFCPAVSYSWVEVAAEGGVTGTKGNAHVNDPSTICIFSQ